jgi:competence protein ComEA
VSRAVALSASLALVLLATGAHAQASPHTPPSVAGAVDNPGVVNLNSASEEQLALLPGIGPQKAKAIVEHRRTHPFHRVEELMKVKGIGHKIFFRLRPNVTLAGPTTLTTEIKMRR